MSHLRRLKKETVGVLTGLGESSDQVAASLQVANVRGVPKDNRSCALAVYLTSIMGSEPLIRSVTVGHCSLLVDLVGQDQRPAGHLLVQLPKPVRQFVAAFDAFRYPAVTRPPAVVRPDCAVSEEAAALAT
jgi:hypothetical protein